jgi:hypothetical protein
MKNTGITPHQIVNGFPGGSLHARIGAALAAVQHAHEVAESANPIRGGHIRSPLLAYAEELTHAITSVLNDPGGDHEDSKRGKVSA